MANLFRNPVFCKLFFATIASQLGTVIGNMALVYYLIDMYSERPSLASTAELMYSLPTLAMFWIVGVLADRFDRKLIVIYSDWIRAGLTILLLVFVQFDLLFLCFVVLFLRSAVSKFYGPAEMGLLQGSIEKELYVQASGLNQLVMGMFMLLGMSLGAVTYHFVGIQGAIIIDGISFIISGLLLSWGSFSEHARTPNGNNHIRTLRISLIVKDFWQGIRYVTGNKLLLVLISGFLFFGVVNGVFSLLPVFTMKYKLSPDRYIINSSLISVFLGVGFLLGSFLGPSMIRRFTRTTTIIASLFISSLLIGGLGLSTRVEVYFVLVLLAGIAVAPINIALGSWIPELVPPQHIGRVNSLIEPVMMLGHSLALGGISLTFPVVLTVTWLHFLLSICTVIVSFFYLTSLPSLTRKILIVPSELNRS